MIVAVRAFSSRVLDLGLRHIHRQQGIALDDPGAFEPARLADQDVGHVHPAGDQLLQPLQLDHGGAG